MSNQRIVRNDRRIGEAIGFEQKYGIQVEEREKI